MPPAFHSLPMSDPYTPIPERNSADLERTDMMNQSSGRLKDENSIAGVQKLIFFRRRGKGFKQLSARTPPRPHPQVAI